MRVRGFLLTFMALVLPGTLAAQIQHYFTAEDVTGDAGAQVLAEIRIVAEADNATAWNAIVCHDNTVAQLVDVPVDPLEPELNALLTGLQPLILLSLDSQGRGFKYGVVGDLQQRFVLQSAQTPLVFARAIYNLTGAAGASTALRFCDGELDMTAPENEITLTDFTVVTPTPRCEDGSLTIAGAGADFEVFFAQDTFDISGGEKVVIEITAPDAVSGVHFGVAQDDPALVATAAAPVGVLLANLTNPANEFYANIVPGGVTIAAARLSSPWVAIPAGDRQPIVEITYACPAGLQAPLDVGLSFSGDIGDPTPVLMRVDQQGVMSPLLAGNMATAHCEGGVQEDFIYWFSATDYEISSDPVVTIQATNPQPINALSFGVAHDDARIAPQSAAPAGALPPLVSEPNEFIVQILAGGVTVAASIDLTAPFETLPAGVRQDIVEITYACPAQNTEEFSGNLTFSDQLGTPRVRMEMSVSNVAQAAQAGNSAVATCKPVVDFIYWFSDTEYRLADDPVVTIQVTNPEPINALSFGVAQSSDDITVTNVEATGDLLTLIQDDPTREFWSLVVEGGVTVGAIIDVVPPFEALDIGNRQDVVKITYQCAGGLEEETRIDLTFSDQLGDPRTRLEMSVQNVAHAAKIGNSAVAICPPGLPPQNVNFARGDVNQDGFTSITDCVVIAMAAAGMGAGTLGCDDAADTENDEDLDVGDVVYLLRYLFANSQMPPAAPFDVEDSLAACGTGDEKVGDGLSCTRYDLCPQP